MDIQLIIADLLAQIFSKELAIVMVLTFCACEAIFAFEKDQPKKRWSDRFKWGTSIVVGGLLGLLVVPPQETIPGWIIGAVGGGILTLGVAKFKTDKDA